MSLYDGPRDVSEKLAELENRLDIAGYDHQKGAMQGWRAERQRARLLDRSRRRQDAGSAAKTRTWFMARLWVLLRSMRLAR